VHRQRLDFSKSSRTESRSSRGSLRKGKTSSFRALMSTVPHVVAILTSPHNLAGDAWVSCRVVKSSRVENEVHTWVDYPTPCFAPQRFHVLVNLRSFPQALARDCISGRPQGSKAGTSFDLGVIVCASIF
jgi:hypothetical protein